MEPNTDGNQRLSLYGQVLSFGLQLGKTSEIWLCGPVEGRKVDKNRENVFNQSQNGCQWFPFDGNPKYSNFITGVKEKNYHEVDCFY